LLYMVGVKSLPRYAADQRIIELELENLRLREEIRVAHEAAELTAHLVVQQFERNETTMGKLRTTTDRLQAILDAASQVAIIAFNHDGMIDLCNLGAERLLGCSGEAHLERRRMNNILVAVVGMEGEITPAYFRTLTERHRGEICEATLRKLDGSVFSVNLAMTGLHDSDGHLYGYLAVAMDVTALKQAEAQLQKSYEELQSANKHLRELDQMKTSFLSSVSHELRTPLTSIRGFAKLIGRDFERTFLPLISDDSKLSRKGQRINENLNIILSESERLTRLINDVLDLAKIESGRMSWHDETLDLTQVLQQALNAAHGQFESKPEVKLVTEIADNLPQIVSDRDRLIQVLVNLINNAVKFTDHGAVTLRAFVNAQRWLQIEVVDTGSGFDPAEAESIFDKFKQASHNDTLTDKPKGTGLGLSICREIVRHYQGDIVATSVPGSGSTFTVTLPAVGLEEEADTAYSAENTASTASTVAMPLILVVDDDPGVCSYLAQLFQENQYRIITADNGKVALEKARAHRPDLITMDLAMPIMDGRMAIEELRADPALNSIPVIVITAMPHLETTGANAAFAKPVEEDKLLTGVKLLLGRRSGKEGNGMRCLVVYDTPEPPPTVPEFCTHFDYCPLSQLMDWVKRGYKGVVVLPTYLLKKVDVDALQAHCGSQMVIFPMDSMEAPRHNVKDENSP
jgi:PAS domain S-box-containing protein